MRLIRTKNTGSEKLIKNLFPGLLFWRELGRGPYLLRDFYHDAPELVALFGMIDQWGENSIPHLFQKMMVKSEFLTILPRIVYNVVISVFLRVQLWKDLEYENEVEHWP